MTRREGSIVEGFAGLRSDYEATKPSRFRRNRPGVPANGAGADYHYRSERDLLKLTECARDLDRNNQHCSALIDIATNNIVQTGFLLRFHTGSAALDRALTEDFAAYMEDPELCDEEGEKSFADFEWHAQRHCFVDGDVVVLATENGTLQMVESHRLRTPTWGKDKNVVNGVKLSTTRRREGYWIANEEIDAFKSVVMGQMDYYPTRADDGSRVVMHVYDPRRTSQTRGVTALAPVFDTLSLIDDADFALLVKQMMASSLAILRERDIAFDKMTNGAYAPSRIEAVENGQIRKLTSWSAGMEVAGLPGEKLSAFSASIPSSEYFAQAKKAIQVVCINLGLPYIAGMMDASETNFSGWRGAMEQAKVGWRRKQNNLKKRFHHPFTDWRIRYLLASNPEIARLAGVRGVNLNGYTWMPRAWAYIQPKDEANADATRLNENLTSGRRVAAERNEPDYELLLDEIVGDRERLITKACEAAERINKVFPVARVSWRDLAGSVGQENVAAPVMELAAEPEETNPPKKTKVEDEQ